MPAKKTKSGLLARLGDRLRKAHEEHKADETEYSNFGELPAGIEGGVAQLVDCKFDQYKSGDNEGETYFYAAGVVVQPIEHDGVRVQGLRTSIMEPMCDTPTRSRPTFEDHLKWIYNELRKLGVETTTLDVDDLETTVAALREAQPYFRFRTWKSQPSVEYPDPRTNHSWAGVTEFTPTEGGAVEYKTKPSANGAATEPFDEFGDLDSLATKADEDDAEAQSSLREMAEKAGITEEQVDEAENWVAVVELIRAGGKEDAEPEEAAEETAEEVSWEPVKEEVYHFRPIDPKSKKPVKKPVEVEIVSVDKKSKTVALKSLDDPKRTWKGVKWDALESAS
jgi:hypothetical protein